MKTSYLAFQQFILHSDKMTKESMCIKDEEPADPFRRRWEEAERALKHDGFIVISNQNQVAGVPVSILVGKAMDLPPRLPVKDNFYVPPGMQGLPFELEQGFKGEIEL